MTHTEELLKTAIQYADTRWSGVDVPIEWVRHFADALAQPAQEPVTWGVDWGKSGDRPCAVITRRLSAACNEVLAVEFAPYTYNEVKEKHT